MPRVLVLALALSLHSMALARPDDPPFPPDERLTALPGVVSVEYVYQRAPFPECHASTIEETPSGLVVAWFGGTREKHPDVCIWVSRRRDGEWSVPEKVADGVQHTAKRYPCWNPVLFRPRARSSDARAPLLLFYKVGPSPSTWWGLLTVSDDDGRTWSEPRRLPEDVLGPIKSKPIQLDDGTILCGSSTEHDGWRVHFERTPDLGRSWEIVGPVNDGQEFGAIQPCLLRLADGGIRALCRSRQGVITTVTSRDGGRTWGPMEASSLPNPNAGTDAVTLRDGSHLLVYNHSTRGGPFPRGRNLLNVAVSRDGTSWQAALVLERSEGEYSYPAVIESSDGRVHITYTYRRRTVKHVVVDPRRLELAPIVDGRWPGP